MESKPITIQDVEIEFGVARSTVMRWIKNGVLKTKQLPLRRRHVVTHQEFERIKNRRDLNNLLEETTMPAKKQLENIRLTSKDIANYCQVTKSTVLLWITSGKLKAFTLPKGHNRIDVKDFKDFLTKYNMPVKGWPFET